MARFVLVSLVLAPLALCDLHAVPTPLAGHIVGEQSTSSGDQWRVVTPIAWGADFPATNVITVRRGARAQTMRGWGSALHDTSGFNVALMNATTRAAFLEAGWGKTGLSWNIGRITLNSADYSVQSYSYDNVTDDFDLTAFDKELSYDKIRVQPFVNAARAVVKARNGGEMLLFASPWSPPAWMKVNNNIVGCTSPNTMKPNATNGRSYLETWANYISMWIDSYEAAGIPIWGVTPQNEPGYSPSNYECCAYDAPRYAEWVGRYLGPKLRASHPTVKIMAWDWNRFADAVPFANALVSGGYSRYVDLVAWHWYNMPDNLGLNYVAQVEAIFPGVPQLATEACYLQSLTETWSTGAELMGLDALADVNWNMTGWVFWSPVVHTGTPSSYEGGPAHDGTRTFSSPVLFRQDGTAGGDSLLLQTSFWAHGHLSRYAAPGAVRVIAGGAGFASTEADFETVRHMIVNNQPPAGPLPLVAAAFVDDAAGVATLVVMNAGTSAATFKLVDADAPGGGAANITIPAHAFQSYRWSL